MNQCTVTAAPVAKLPVNPTPPPGFHDSDGIPPGLDLELTGQLKLIDFTGVFYADPTPLDQRKPILIRRLVRIKFASPEVYVADDLENGNMYVVDRKSNLSLGCRMTTTLVELPDDVKKMIEDSMEKTRLAKEARTARFQPSTPEPAPVPVKQAKPGRVRTLLNAITGGPQKISDCQARRAGVELTPVKPSVRPPVRLVAHPNACNRPIPTSAPPAIPTRPTCRELRAAQAAGSDC